MDRIEGKRGQIIDAAVVEFRENGFAGASMDRVSARACVSKRTVYNHFESKEVLFRAILEIMIDRANRSFDVTYDPMQPLRPQLVALCWTEGNLLTDPDFMKLARMVVGEIMRDPALAEISNQKMAHGETFRAFIDSAMTAGTLTVDDPARATEQLIGLIKSQAFWPVIFSGVVVDREEMGRIIETTVNMFLKEYAAAVN